MLKTMAAYFLTPAVAAIPAPLSGNSPRAEVFSQLHVDQPVRNDQFSVFSFQVFSHGRRCRF